MPTLPSNTDLTPLLSSTQGELYSLLGASALALEAPDAILRLGRDGSLWQTPPSVLGNEPPFEHSGLQRVGEAFLREWGGQLKRALCGNEALYKEEQNRGMHDIDLYLGSLSATICASIPALSPFTPLVTILSVIIVKTGLRAFCATLLPEPTKGST